jgi:hypothetical protein
MMYQARGQEHVRVQVCGTMQTQEPTQATCSAASDTEQAVTRIPTADTKVSIIVAALQAQRPSKSADTTPQQQRVHL